MTENISLTLTGRETGSIECGKVGDDVVVIEGCLKSNQNRTYAKVIITHNGNDCIFEMSMIPHKEMFMNFFTGIRFEGSQIMLDYNANNVGQMVQFNGTITYY